MTEDVDLKAIYDDANRLECDLPSQQVRIAVLAHAAAVLARQGQGANPEAPRVIRVKDAGSSASNNSHWKMAMVASVLLAPVLGILVFQLSKQDDTGTSVQVAANTQYPQSLEYPAASAQQPLTRTLPIAQVQGKSQESVQSRQTGPTTAVRDVPVVVAELTNQADATTGASPESGHSSGGAASQDRAENLGLAGPSAKVATAPSTPGVLMPILNSAQKAKNSNGFADAVATETGAMLDQLGQASREGNVSAVVSLVKRGTPVNGLDTKGYTALINAIAAHQASSVEALMGLGADPSIRGTDGVSAVEWARRVGDKEIMKLLVR